MLTSTGSAATAVMTSPDAPAKKVVWDKRLSAIFWVNSVAISNDGRRVVAATYLHDYNQKTGKGLPNLKSKFGTFCLDGAPAEDGASKNPLWSNEYDAWDGVFGVAISGDGTIAAASGFRDLTPATTVGIAVETTVISIAPMKSPRRRATTVAGRCVRRCRSASWVGVKKAWGRESGPRGLGAWKGTGLSPRLARYDAGGPMRGSFSAAVLRTENVHE